MLVAIDNSGGDRIRALRASGANGGCAAPRGDGKIRWRFPRGTIDLGDEDAALHGECDDRIRVWGLLPDPVDRTLLN